MDMVAVQGVGLDTQEVRTDMKIKWYWVCWKCGKTWDASAGPEVLTKYTELSDLDRIAYDDAPCKCKNPNMVLASMTE